MPSELGQSSFSLTRFRVFCFLLPVVFLWYVACLHTITQSQTSQDYNPQFLTQLQNSNITSTMAPAAIPVPVQLLHADFAKCFWLTTLQKQNDDRSAAAAAQPTVQEVATTLLAFPQSARSAWSLDAAQDFNFPAAVGTPAVCCDS
jgi:hypothetical protein